MYNVWTENIDRGSRVYDILCEGYESFRIVHLGCIAIVTHYIIIIILERPVLICRNYYFPLVVV